jgi:hypothetical protein
LDIKFSLEYAQMFFKKTLHRFNSSNGFPWYFPRIIIGTSLKIAIRNRFFSANIEKL